MNEGGESAKFIACTVTLLQNVYLRLKSSMRLRIVRAVYMGSILRDKTVGLIEALN
jgi:hypothetical protein